MYILVPWKPVVLVWGLLSAMIFFGFVASSVLEGKDPFAPSAPSRSVQPRKRLLRKRGNNLSTPTKRPELRVSETSEISSLICFLGVFGHVLAWFTFPNIFSSFCFRTTSAGERPWRPSHETKSFILTSCFMGGCWTRTVTVENPWPISPTQLSCCNAASAVAIAS